MARPEAGFGKFKNLGGKAWHGLSTEIPLPLLQQMAKNVAIPQTVSTLTLAIPGAVTRSVPMWIGNDFVEIKESVSYTVVPGTASTFYDSDGVTAAAQVTAATCYYMYIGLSTAGAIQYYPSSAAPSRVEGPYESAASWAHPGTTRGKHMAYTGWFQATTTVPALAQTIKEGFVYSNPVPTAMGVLQVTGVSTGAMPVDMTTMIPLHDVKLGGYVQNSTIAVGGTAFSVGANSLTATAYKCISYEMTWPAIANFYGLVPGTAGNLWVAQSASLANLGDCWVTLLEDVV